MIKVSEHKETGDVEILYDDETLQGNQLGLRIDDEVGMGLLADLCNFYEAKGYKPIMHLINAKAAAERAATPSLLQRIARFFKGA